MKIFSRYSVYITSSLLLPAINFAFPLPATAAIVCEPGTISNFQNGSLERCILAQNISVQNSSNSGDISTLPCSAKNYIFFNEKGQFQRCQLSDPIQIRTGNSVETCPAESTVSLTISEKGNQSIACHHPR